MSFNVNGIRARQHQMQAITTQLQPEILGLQEVKAENSQYPENDIRPLGWHSEVHGQKSHYGVALLGRQAPLTCQKGFPWDAEDAQRRFIHCSYATQSGKTLHVINGYFPQGESQDHPTKFPAKRAFYADLQRYLESTFTADDWLIVMGDMNISHTDADIGIGEINAKRWLKTGKCSFLPEEREWMETLLSFGLVDSYRYLHPQKNDKFSWFDYRSKGFEDEPKRGLRIDLILISQNLVPHLQAADIDYAIRGMEKPSDHAPIWLELDI